MDRSQCFSHGQLNVGMTRVRSVKYIIVCTNRGNRKVKNIVMEELLDKEDLEMPEIQPEFPQDPDDFVRFYIIIF